MASGIGTQRRASVFTFSAMPPQPSEPITRSPGFSPVTPSPMAETMPLTSPPGENGRSGLYW
jgi:hypothetical protein